MVKEFVATGPRVVSPKRTVKLDITPDEYYLDPEGNARRLYESF
jgi:hypothetical protein